MLDVRLGVNRIRSDNEADVFDNFDYARYGISPELQALNVVPGAPPSFTPGRVSDLHNGQFLHKRERQTNTDFNGSVTWTRGKWTHKFGGTYRVLLSNYTDPHDPALIIEVRSGFAVRLALAQKYQALYTQNDWRVNDRLTLNLGLRYDIQPGPTERFNNISAIDLDQKNPFGTPGRIIFPGVNVDRRNMWPTQWKDFGPRFGAA